jgi:serine/threonine protein kinase
MQVLEPSTCIAHYRLLRRIARGGMSHVYLATDLFTDRLVAIKLVDSNHSEYCERFQREIRALAELSHDHILPVLDYGIYESWRYMAMPYIEHGTLRERLARGPMAVKEAGRILEQVASAVQYAHDHAIIHRDIKPSNILLRDGEHVYLTDFGLVKLLSEESQITQVGSLLGTPAYMAPELAEHAATTRSDIYALGIVLYQMLTGHVPFESTTPMGVYWKHLSEQPQPPSTRNPAIPPAFDSVVLQALEKNPEHRFKTVREFADAYQRVLKVRPVEARIVASLHSPAFHATINRTSRFRVSQLLQHTVLARGAAVALVAMMFFFVAPLWLGFAFYSMQNRPHSAASIEISAPLAVGHAQYVLPDLRDFPRVPPSHHQPLPTPSIALSGSPPPSSPHKHRRKHGQEQEQKQKQEQEHISGPAEAWGPLNDTVGTLPGSAAYVRSWTWAEPGDTPEVSTAFLHL